MRPRPMPPRTHRDQAHLTQVPPQVGLGYSPASTARLLSGIATTAGAGVGYWLLRGRRARANLDWTPPSGRAHSGTLHARIVDGGGERDVVVLLHGLAASNLYWGAKYDQLASGGLLVAPDLLGFGSSPRPDVHYTPTTTPTLSQPPWPKSASTDRRSSSLTRLAAWLPSVSPPATRIGSGEWSGSAHPSTPMPAPHRSA